MTILRGLNPKEALAGLLSRYPELTIHYLWNYSLRYYLVQGVKNEKDMYNDPYYIINKHTGVIRRYSCGENMMKFLRVIDTKPLVSVKTKQI